MATKAGDNTREALWVPIPTLDCRGNAQREQTYNAALSMPVHA